MKYKLLHKLFGWDYVAWKNTADQGIACVHIAGDGQVFYWRYKLTKVPDKITSASQVIWLTCTPDKYLK